MRERQTTWSHLFFSFERTTVKRTLRLEQCKANKPNSAVRLFVSLQGAEVLVVLAALLAHERPALDVGRLDVMLKLSFQPEAFGAEVTLVLLLDGLFRVVEVVVLLQVGLLRKSGPANFTNERLLA